MSLKPITQDGNWLEGIGTKIQCDHIVAHDKYFTMLKQSEVAHCITLKLNPNDIIYFNYCPNCDKLLETIP